VIKIKYSIIFEASSSDYNLFHVHNFRFIYVPKVIAGNCYYDTYNITLCGLVVRVPGYISRGPGFDSRRYQIF
jgi:hypothetical protein